MKPNFSAHSLIASVALAMALGIPPAPAGAATTDISSVPLGTASATAVLPNLMFILDDSGSMGWYFMPDNVDALKLPGDFPGSISSTVNCKSYALTSGGTTRNNCIVDSGTVNTISPTTDGVRHVPANDWPAGPPAYAAEYNTIYYNPQITYLPGKDSGGLDLPSFGSPWALVKVNPYVSNNTIDLTAQWPEPVFCDNSNDDPNAAIATFASNCRRNGYANDAVTLLTSFRYSNASASATGSYGWPIGTGGSDYKFIRMRFGAPYYFTILPREYCSDLDLTNCHPVLNAHGQLHHTRAGTVLHDFQPRQPGRAGERRHAGILSGQARREPHLPEVRHVRSHRHRPFGCDLRRPAQSRRLCGAARLHLRGGDDQLRELGRLLPYPHPDDEEHDEPRVFQHG